LSFLVGNFLCCFIVSSLHTIRHALCFRSIFPPWAFLFPIPALSLGPLLVGSLHRFKGPSVLLDPLCPSSADVWFLGLHLGITRGVLPPGCVHSFLLDFPLFFAVPLPSNQVAPPLVGAIHVPPLTFFPPFPPPPGLPAVLHPPYVPKFPTSVTPLANCVPNGGSLLLVTGFCGPPPFVILYRLRPGCFFAC